MGFDPLGFVTPIVLEAKLQYRNLCEKKLDWDESMNKMCCLRNLQLLGNSLLRTPIKMHQQSSVAGMFDCPLKNPNLAT